VRNRTKERVGIVLFAVVHTIGAPAIARAQQPAPAAQPSQPTPRERVATGDRLQRMHLHEAALAEYEKAYEAAPSPATLRKIADAQRDMGDVASAIASYERVLAAPDASRDDKRASEKALKALEAESGALTISSTVEGAAVTIDGRPAGTTPLAKPIRVAPRAHVVRVTKQGYEPFETTTEVAAGGSSSVAANLVEENTKGGVHVREAGNRSVQISIDGKPAGTTPFTGDLPPGEHTFEIADPKLTGPKKTATIVAKQRTEVVLTASDALGLLKLETRPADAEIVIDGKPIAKGTREIELAPGAHTIFARANGYNAVTQTVDVVAGRPVTLGVTLEKLVVAPAAKEEEWDGGHFDVGLVGALPLHERLAVCPPSSLGADCTEDTRLGGGLMLRGGYNFDPVGLDLTAIGLLGHEHDVVNYKGGVTGATTDARFQNTQDFVLVSGGGVIAAGPTVTSRGDVFRVTAGIGAGVSVRFIHFERVVSGMLVDRTEANDTAVGPAATGHASILLGATPGVKLEAGFNAVVERLASSTSAERRRTPDPNAQDLNVPSYELMKSVQVYIGPFLGARFGY
jgi:hypothetical protein